MSTTCNLLRSTLPVISGISPYVRQKGFCVTFYASKLGDADGDPDPNPEDYVLFEVNFFPTTTASCTKETQVAGCL